MLTIRVVFRYNWPRHVQPRFTIKLLVKGLQSRPLDLQATGPELVTLHQLGAKASERRRGLSDHHQRLTLAVPVYRFDQLASRQ